MRRQDRERAGKRLTEAEEAEEVVGAWLGLLTFLSSLLRLS